MKTKLFVIFAFLLTGGCASFDTSLQYNPQTGTFGADVRYIDRSKG